MRRVLWWGYERSLEAQSGLDFNRYNRTIQRQCESGKTKIRNTRKLNSCHQAVEIKSPFYSRSNLPKRKRKMRDPGVHIERWLNRRQEIQDEDQKIQMGTTLWNWYYIYGDRKARNWLSYKLRCITMTIVMYCILKNSRRSIVSCTDMNTTTVLWIVDVWFLHVRYIYN